MSDVKFYSNLPYRVISRERNGITRFYVRFNYCGKEVDRVLKNCLDREQADMMAPVAYVAETEKLRTEDSIQKPHRSSSVTMETAIRRVFLDENATYFIYNSVRTQQKKQYQSRCNTYLIPYFRDVRINCVTIDTINGFRSFLANFKLGKDKNRTLNAKTRHEIEWLARTVMKWIPTLYPNVNNFINPYASPMVKTISYNKKKNAIPAFDLEEIRALFSVQWDRYPCLCMALLAAYTGIRSNEDAGLMKSKFYASDEYCIIEITESWTFEEMHLKEPKTENGIRKNVIPRWLFDFISPLLNHVPDDCFPFHNTKSNTVPMKGDRYNDALRGAAEKAGFLPRFIEKKMQFYSFRTFYRSHLETTLGHEAALLRFVMGHSEKDCDDHYFRLLKEHIGKLLHATEDILTEDIIESLFSQQCYLDFVASLTPEKNNQDCGSEVSK